VRIHRFLSLTDLVVLLVVAVAIFLPKRPQFATSAYKLDVDERADLAATEASAYARPDDGEAAARLSRRMVSAGMIDWGIEAGRAGAAKATKATRWDALLAASEALATRGKIEEAVALAKEARDACLPGPVTTCPEWQPVKLDLWVGYLEAGLASGIDPLRDPAGFRQAADGAMNWVDIEGLSPGGVSGSGSAPR
jgi:hypothetical protein